MAKEMSVITRIKADVSNFMNGMKQAENKAKSFSSNMKSNLDKAGSNISNFGKSISGVGDSLNRKITMPAVAAASALAGVTLVKGFGRLVGIDTAQAKLKGLGHDAESVEEIMNSALDSVRGTSYGLDEAATTAANAVAAGIKPGQDLTRYLSLTGDAAAIAGSSMGEMGSIINKVQTAQKAYTGELNMLADRGIPIFQWLAEEANVSAEEVRDMASDGKVSSEMFLAAIEKNIGGAAKVIGEESFVAGIANIGAAIGRLGANFLDAGGEGEGFFSTIKPLIGETIGYIDNLADKAADIGVKFGEAFNTFLSKISELKARFDELSPSMQEIILKTASVGAAIAVGIGPALKIVGFLVTSFGGLVSTVGLLINPITLVVIAIAGLVAAFVVAYNQSETFREGVNTVFTGIQNIVTSILSAVVTYLKEKLDQIKVFWDENGQQIMQAVENAFSFIRGYVEFVMPILQNIIGNAWSIIQSIFDAAVGIIMGLVKTFASLLTGDFEGIKEGLTQIWESLWSGIEGIVSGAWSLLSGAFSTLWSQIEGWFGDLKTIAVDWGKNFIDGFVDGMKSMGQKVADAAGDVVKKAGEFLKFWSPAKKGEGRYIVHWGRNMVDGFLDGVRDESAQAGKVIDDMIKSMSPKALNFSLATNGTISAGTDSLTTHEGKGRNLPSNVNETTNNLNLTLQIDTMNGTKEDTNFVLNEAVKGFEKLGFKF